MKNKKIIVKDIGITSFSDAWKFQEDIFQKIIDQKVKNRTLVKKIKTENCLTVVTDGPNVACGVNNKGVTKIRPKFINSNISRLGAGDAFFAYFLA